MTPRPNELAVREAGRTEFRTDPLRIRFDLAELITADRHELRCIFECSVRVGDHSADRELFAELLMEGRPAVTRDDVVFHLRPAIESAAQSAASQPVSTILSEPGKAAFLEAIRKSVDAAAFNSGLMILPPFELDLSSPSLQRQQREAAQRSRVEEQAAGRLDHLRRAAELLKQFDSIRTAAPSISAGQVLERIAPGDRGALLDAILASNADHHAQQTLYAVAGSQLVTLDLRSESIQPKAIELPISLGPLRSVQPAEIDGDRRLLIGARGGVFLLDPKDPAAAVAYAEPELNSSLGFNRAIFLPAARAIVATHGEAGLVRWEHGNPATPSSRTRPSELATLANGPVRNIQALDRSTAICSVGPALAILNGSERQSLVPGSASSIISIVPDNDRLFAIHEDGSVATIDRQSRQILRTDSYGVSICAAGALPWLDGLRLLLAAASGPVDCVGPDDSLVTRFNSVYRGLRSIAASSTFIAAVSPDRQRLILWNSWDGRAPAQDLHLISLTRHRIADITFA
jgi:hypothetical protein